MTLIIKLKSKKFNMQISYVYTYYDIYNSNIDIYIYIYITKIYFPKPPLQTGLGDILHLSFH